MKSEYSIYEAKSKFSQILRLVKTSRNVTITERGVPIARISIYSEPKSLEMRLEEMLAQGRLIRPKILLSQTLKALKTHKRPGALVRFLEERE